MKKYLDKKKEIDISRSFSSKEWHDAVILRCIINYEESGTDEEILLRIQWTENEENWVCFHHVLWAQILFLGGFSAPENILFAFDKDDCEELSLLRKRAPNLYPDEKMRYYEIETTQSAGTIKIIASSVSMIHP